MVKIRGYSIEIQVNIAAIFVLYHWRSLDSYLSTPAFGYRNRIEAGVRFKVRGGVGESLV